MCVSPWIALQIRKRTISASRTDLPDRSFEATIAAIGSGGDGTTRIEGESLFVPFALPGERVLLRRAGRQTSLEAVLQASKHRAEPVCGLFGACGGCALQHMDAELQRDFKQGLVSTALREAGFTLPAEIAWHVTGPRTRRRMDLALRRTPVSVLIGLHRRAGEVVDLNECHVLHPTLFGLLQEFRPVALRLTCLRASGSAIVNLLDSGPDMLIVTDQPPVPEDRVRLAAFAEAVGIPRISWRAVKPATAECETVCLLGPVHHAFSGKKMAPPPGAFLQASRDGEAAIIASVLAGLPRLLPSRARVVELYAGCGTLSFALAGRAKVSAFEGDKVAVSCLKQACGGTRIEVAARDLVRQPLLAKEFKGASAVVMDPPYGGAGPQMPEVARAKVARVIMVSCNPAALARDASMLRSAGYQLAALSVIDQFVWSSNVECVSTFKLGSGA